MDKSGERNPNKRLGNLRIFVARLSVIIVNATLKGTDLGSVVPAVG